MEATAHQPLERKPPALPKGRQAPVCGVMSLLTPAFVIGAWYAVSLRSWNEFNGYLGLIVFLVLWIGSFAVSGLGGVLAIVALFRRERWPGLAILGLALNVIAYVWIRGGGAY